MVKVVLAAGLALCALLTACGSSEQKAAGLSEADVAFISCADEAWTKAEQSWEIGISASSDAYAASVDIRQTCTTPTDPELLKLRDDLGGTLKGIDDNTGSPDLVIAGWDRAKELALTLDKFKDLAREQRVGNG